jgi:hypothetical protein
MEQFTRFFSMRVDAYYKEAHNLLGEAQRFRFALDTRVLSGLVLRLIVNWPGTFGLD